MILDNGGVNYNERSISGSQKSGIFDRDPEPDDEPSVEDIWYVLKNKKFSKSKSGIRFKITFNNYIQSYRFLNSQFALE